MEWIGYTEKEYKQVLNLKKRMRLDDIVRITGIPLPTVSKWIYSGKKPFFISEQSLTEYQRGFLEALIDGEGSLRLARNYIHKDTPKRKAGIRWSARMEISNTNRELLEKAKSFVKSGCIIFEKRRNPKHRDRYKYQIAQLRPILPQLELIVKKKQKKLLIEALNILHKRMRTHKFIDEDRLVWIHDEIKKINKREDIMEKPAST